MEKRIRKILSEHIVTILFVILCIVAIIASKQTLGFIANELLTRIGRNGFLVLSLIIPVLAGMGMNFGIVIGAMAGQIAIIFLTHFGATGLSGLLYCVLFSTPLAIVFGWMTGVILNKTKGQEMITSMILGFFANGLYQLLFLFLVGTVIPMDNPVLVISGGVGIKNTIDLSDGLKYSLDGLMKRPLFETLIVIGILVLIYSIYTIYKNRNNTMFKSANKMKFYGFLGIVFLGAGIYIKSTKTFFLLIKVPIITYLVIAALCIFNVLIVKTKLGQDFRTVGQDRNIAEIAGINVDRVRITSIIISTVLAAWGQLIFLQNLGTLNTYGSHEQVGTFAVAALLIGGASVSRATIGQALLGVALFHTLFIVSPMAGKNLFGNAQIGEYFRTFVSYGVIGLSLGLHAWKTHIMKKNKGKE